MRSNLKRRSAGTRTSNKKKHQERDETLASAVPREGEKQSDDSPQQRDHAIERRAKKPRGKFQYIISVFHKTMQFNA